MVKSTNTTRKSGSVNMANKMFYGIGDFGFNMVINTLGSFVLFFSTTVHGINSMLVGFAIGLSMVWDAITDPITGFISDRTKSIFFGRRHGFMRDFGICRICFRELASKNKLPGVKKASW